MDYGYRLKYNQEQGHFHFNDRSKGGADKNTFGWITITNYSDRENLINFCNWIEEDSANLDPATGKIKLTVDQVKKFYEVWVDMKLIKDLNEGG